MIPPALSDLREQLAVDADGHRLVDLCLQVVIVLDGPLAPAMPRVQRLYDGFMARYADRIRLAYGYDERQMRPFDPDEWRDAARWLDAPLSVGGGSFSGGGGGMPSSLKDGWVGEMPVSSMQTMTPAPRSEP